MLEVDRAVDFDDDEWLSFTPAGAYAGTEEVSDRVAWAFDDPPEVVFLTGHADAAFFAFFLPAGIASGMLAFVFDWLVHHPHHVPVNDRYRTSNVYLFPKEIHWPVTVLWIFQNYHIIHHLYPRVAFYSYPQVLNRISKLLDAANVAVQKIMDTPAS